MSRPDGAVVNPADPTDRDNGARWAFTLAPHAAGEAHRRLAEILRFDYGPGAAAVADAQPCRVSWVSALEGVGIDTVCMGFLPNEAADIAAQASPPPGLEWTGPGPRMGPSGGSAGRPWRDIARRLSERPRFSEVFGRHRVPLLVPDPVLGVMHRSRVVLTPDEGPIYVGYRCCRPEVSPAMQECAPWHLEVALEVARGTRWAGDAGAPDRPRAGDRPVMW